MKKLLLISALFLGSCSPLLEWQTKYPDNFAEEYIESRVEEQFGRDFDLTPLTGKERQEIELKFKY